MNHNDEINLPISRAPEKASRPEPVEIENGPMLKQLSPKNVRQRECQHRQFEKQLGPAMTLNHQLHLADNSRTQIFSLAIGKELIDWE